jgi:hypothetical protein
VIVFCSNMQSAVWMTPLILASQLVDAVYRRPASPNLENALFLEAGSVLNLFGFHTTMVREHKKQPAAVERFSVFQYLKSSPTSVLAQQLSTSICAILALSNTTSRALHGCGSCRSLRPCWERKVRHSNGTSPGQFLNVQKPGPTYPQQPLDLDVTKDEVRVLSSGKKPSREGFISTTHVPLASEEQCRSYGL